MTWIKYPKEEALVLDNDDMFDFGRLDVIATHRERERERERRPVCISPSRIDAALIVAAVAFVKPPARCLVLVYRWQTSRWVAEWYRTSASKVVYC